MATNAAPEQDPVAAVYGIAKLNRRTDDLMRELRGDPDTV